MPKKSWWESPFWKALGALAALVTIIGFLLQIFGAVDVYNLLVVPIINFFTFPVPLYSIPLAFLVVLAIFFLWLYLGDKSSPVSVSNPLARADILDDDDVRYVAVLSQTPRTADFLKKKYDDFRYQNEIRGGYSSDRLLKEMEERGLLEFQLGEWKVTQKALAYIDKYHGG